MVFCNHCGKENPDQARFCFHCGKPLVIEKTDSVIQQDVSLSTSETYAGFWRRFGAALIDGLILCFGGLIIGFIVGFIYGLITKTAAGAEVLGYIVGIGINWLYYAIMESSSQQATVGKMAIGIKVTDIGGNRISFVRATGRYFAKIISTLILFIGYIMIAFTEKKQGLHDMIAGTLVIKK